MTEHNLNANQTTVDPLFLRGIEQFNEQEFFECHEVLEELWNRQLEPEKQLTQGILQIAVGYYHYLRGNYEGTRRLFRRGLPRVTPFRDDNCCPLSLGEFIQIVETGLRQLEENIERLNDAEGGISERTAGSTKAATPAITDPSSANAGSGVAKLQEPAVELCIPKIAFKQS